MTMPLNCTNYISRPSTDANSKCYIIQFNCIAVLILTSSSRSSISQISATINNGIPQDSNLTKNTEQRQ
ncbi:hypothetical protein VNO78_20988 [Psophocarpus tetragonolobus]|uniref:Uncharacterized protein n=1 Tax=Psophocarpus tetragonolobus TaxID=3891 RepID=A0AAN9XHM4_PSOTE